MKHVGLSAPGELKFGGSGAAEVEGRPVRVDGAPAVAEEVAGVEIDLDPAPAWGAADVEAGHQAAAEQRAGGPGDFDVHVRPGRHVGDQVVVRLCSAVSSSRPIG